MTQLKEQSFDANLVENGAFTAGLSHWFGSYLRHEKVPGGVVSGGIVAPTYQVTMPNAISADYLEGVPGGLNQFIDLPEVYTYPSRRTASLITFWYVGNGEAALKALPVSRLNNGPLSLGIAGATGDELYSEHPFVYRYTGGSVVPEIGTSILVSSTYGQVAGEYRVGPVILDTAPQPWEFQDHVLRIASAKESVPEISGENDFPDVDVVVFGPNQAGVAQVQFINGRYDQILNFQRPDGSTGIKVNDSIVIDGKGMRVDTVATSNTSNPSEFYNIFVQNIPGVDGVTEEFNGKEWAVYPQVEVGIDFDMPLYRYDYTLTYSYLSTNTPLSSRITFFSVNGVDQEINGLGEEVTSIVSDPDEAIVGQIIGGASWRKRYEYLTKESPEKIQGRPLLTIPPPQAIISLQQSPATQMVYRETPAPLVEVDYTYTVPSGGSTTYLSVTQAVFNPPAGELTLTLSTSSPFILGAVSIVGWASDVSNPWLYEICSSTGPFSIVNSSGLEVVLAIPPGTTSVTSGGPFTVNGLGLTSMKVTEGVNAETKFRNGDVVQFNGTVGVSDEWVEDLLGVSFQIEDQEVVATDSTTATLRFEVTPTTTITVAPDTTADLTDDAVNMNEVLSSSQTTTISDVVLRRGFTFHRLSSNDTTDIKQNLLNLDLTTDDHIKNIDPVGNVVPKGTTILYAGGGTCPGGFKPVRNFAGADAGSQGVPGINEVPAPDEVIYDADSDTTVFRFLSANFDRLGLEGEPQYIENTDQYVSVAIPGITDVNGDPIYQQVRTPRVKQLIEPGMTLRIPERVYEENDSQLVDSGVYNELEYFSPIADADRGFLVTYIQPNNSLGVTGTAGSAKAVRWGNFTGTSSSGFGDGFGEISYPSSVSAIFRTDINDRNYYPDVPPAGPPRNQQDNLFSGFGDRELAFVSIRSLSADNQKYVCSRFEFYDEIPGLEVSGVEIIEENDYLKGNDGGTNPLVTGDVFYAQVFAYTDPGGLPAAPPSNPGGGGIWITINSNVEYEEIDSFPCYIERTSGGAGINVYRYDLQPIKLMGLGDSNVFPSNVIDGNRECVIRGIIVLRPVKLYGAPGVPQQILPAEDSTRGESPQGVGTGFVQSQVNASSLSVWVSRALVTAVDITVAGNATIPTGVNTLFVEPAGYLRYDDPGSGIDYGVSGHAHIVGGADILSEENYLPRLEVGQHEFYGPTRLPSEHGHGNVGGVVYPLPAAALMTLCIKL